MVDMSNAESKSMYSWWWDSHIGPNNNSQWIQQNLTVMEAKVKQMIEIIEEDAETFAERAEMYYKKRPELINLVEEFYRSYRALAERYDNVTGLIRHAHYDLPDSFPNVMEITQSVKVDASNNFHDIRTSTRDDDDDDISRKGLNELNEAAVSHRKLFDETEEINVKNVEEEKEEEEEEEDFVLSDEWERMNKVEAEILGLKKGVERIESEKEVGLLFEYEEGRMCNIESGVYDVRDKCEGVEERTSKAEAEVEKMKEAITKLYAQKEAASVMYQHCFNKIHNLENNNNNQPSATSQIQPIPISVESE